MLDLLLTFLTSLATIRFRWLSEMSTDDESQHWNEHVEPPARGVTPLHSLWIQRNPLATQFDEDRADECKRIVAPDFADLAMRWHTDPFFKPLRDMVYVFASGPFPRVNKIVAFGLGSVISPPFDATALHSALLMLRYMMARDMGHIRILVHDSLCLPWEASALRDHDIEAVTAAEAILTIDRRSIVFIGSSDVPVIDILADLPERPAIIVTNFFAIRAEQ